MSDFKKIWKEMHKDDKANLAATMDLSQTYLSTIANGKRPTWTTATTLASYLESTPESLFPNMRIHRRIEVPVLPRCLQKLA